MKSSLNIVQGFITLFDDPAIVHNPSPRLLDTPCVLQQQNIKLLFVQDQITQERPDLVRLPFGFDLEQGRKPGSGFVGQVVLGEVADVLDGLVALVGGFLGVDDAFALLFFLAAISTTDRRSIKNIKNIVGNTYSKVRQIRLELVMKGLLPLTHKVAQDPPVAALDR